VLQSLKPYVIYGLLDPDTLELRYIGKTNQPEKRMKQHLYASQLKTKTHRNDWIRSLLQQGKKPAFIVLEQNVQDADEAEISWIVKTRQLGARLTNGTNGGDGHKGGHPLSVETRRKIAHAHKGQKRSPEAIVAMKAAQTDEWRRKRQETKMATKKPNPSSGYVGVSWSKQAGKWRAHYQNDGVQVHLGNFIDPREAAMIYDHAVVLSYQNPTTNLLLGLV
jgi:hypothetical protein